MPDCPVFGRIGKTKFIADAMLGRLARWLRILGFDVLYYPDIADNQVVRIARQEERIILTRDTGLASRKGTQKVIFITSGEVTEQLSEIRESLRFEDASSLGRCALCNGALAEVKVKADVRDAVPDHVYLNSDLFLRCGDCGKVYWEGSHQERFQERIRRILKVNGED